MQQAQRQFASRWLVLVILVLAATSGWSRGAGARSPAQANATQTATAFPVTRVVLFRSGVAYYERAGVIDADATVRLSFPTASVSDLLKSLVVRDLDGGTISAVT